MIDKVHKLRQAQEIAHELKKIKPLKPAFKLPLPHREATVGKTLR